MGLAGSCTAPISMALGSPVNVGLAGPRAQAGFPVSPSRAAQTAPCGCLLLCRHPFWGTFPSGSLLSTLTGPLPAFPSPSAFSHTSPALLHKGWSRGPWECKGSWDQSQGRAARGRNWLYNLMTAQERQLIATWHQEQYHCFRTEQTVCPRSGSSIGHLGSPVDLPKVWCCPCCCVSTGCCSTPSSVKWQWRQSSLVGSCEDRCAQSSKGSCSPDCALNKWRLLGTLSRHVAKVQVMGYGCSAPRRQELGPPAQCLVLRLPLQSALHFTPGLGRSWGCRDKGVWRQLLQLGQEPGGWGLPTHPPAGHSVAPRDPEGLIPSSYLGPAAPAALSLSLPQLHHLYLRHCLQGLNLPNKGQNHELILRDPPSWAGMKHLSPTIS